MYSIERMLVAAWGGALLFLASLGYFGWFYLVRLGDAAAAAPETSATAIAVDVALFTTFALHHSILARTGVKAWVARRLPVGLERSFYVWTASLLFLAVCLLWLPLPGTAWRASGPLAVVLHGAQIAGVVVTLRSASRIDIWELAGVRQARAAVRTRSFDPASTQPAKPAAAPAQSALEIHGPYRWVRHPIYFGWVLMVFGAPAMTASRLLFATISTLYLVIAIPFEERSLGEEFGRAYTDYQQRVRWRLVPGVW
jgi:protein-S-isoprenylcysteine O-methyltransferase Ste14